MGMNVFGWLRKRICDAVLGGINDAVSIVETTTVEGDTPSLADALRARLALPAPESEESDEEGEEGTPRRRRKAS